MSWVSPGSFQNKHGQIWGTQGAEGGWFVMPWGLNMQQIVPLGFYLHFKIQVYQQECYFYVGKRSQLRSYPLEASSLPN